MTIVFYLLIRQTNYNHRTSPPLPNCKYFKTKKHGLFIELGTLCKTFRDGGNTGSAYLRTEAGGRTANCFRSSDTRISVSLITTYLVTGTFMPSIFRKKF